MNITPNPYRLSILTDLRVKKGLTLTDMARKCGLYGRQSRLTAGAWEAGKITPSPRRRPKFIGYLWDDLVLRQSPKHFEEVWMILVEEWRWMPISDIEWALFTNVSRDAKKMSNGYMQADSPEVAATGTLPEQAILTGN